MTGLRQKRRGGDNGSAETDLKVGEVEVEVPNAQDATAQIDAAIRADDERRAQRAREKAAKEQARLEREALAREREMRRYCCGCC